MLDPTRIRKFLSDLSAKEAQPMSAGVKGALIGMFDKQLKVVIGAGEAEAARKLVWGWLFASLDSSPRSMSSKELTWNQWYALARWGWEKAEYNHMREDFPAELLQVYNYAVHDLDLYVSSAEAGKSLTVGDLLDLRQNDPQNIPDAAGSLPGAVLQPVYVDINQDDGFPQDMAEMVKKYGAERIRSWLLKG